MSTSATRRALCRSIILGGAAAVATGTATARPVSYGPDDELIRLCLQFDTYTDRIRATYNSATIHAGEQEADILCDCLSEQQEAILARMVRLRANTFAGCVARANSFLRWAPETQMQANGGSFDEMMLWALLRDLTEI